MAVYLVYLKYLWSLLRHKWFVLLGGIHFYRKIHQGVSLWTLLIHDWSKFKPVLFCAYANQFYGKGCPQFQQAWEQHYQLEPHHPESWVIPGWEGGLPMLTEMDLLDIREMVIDWMGSGRTYTGSWDMSEWLKANLSKKPFHWSTLVIVKELLILLGYDMTLLTDLPSLARDNERLN